MSDALEGVYNAFLTNTIPKIWAKVCYPSLKSLGSWTRDLELRIDFIDTWLKYGLPQSFWLSGFFFPQGFMTGVLQTHARKYDLPIDQLKVDFEVRPTTLAQEEIYTQHKEAGKEVLECYKGLRQPEDGVLVHGLFLDAAKFDTSKMVLSDPNPGEVNPPLPAMALVPVTDRPSMEGRYECPLYKTSVRAGVLSTTGHSTNFVITVLLPSDHPQSYWILKGTALLTQVTD
uniref:Dynein heavy chain C-terminal domain-containing protein n=1 Tax=Lygus hesperus TaxID=30085 RepID=A0A0K8SMG0_LYGHE